MKKIQSIISLFLLAFLIGCSSDDTSLDSVTNAPAPSNLSALFTITQDNSGRVTIAPRGEGLVKYDVYFGDATAEPAEVAVGRTVEHIYAEGQYDVKIVATAINGLTSEVVLPLTVAFRAPENLAVTISPVVGDSFSINVTASADFETFFEVTFGEDPAQEPIPFMQGGTPVAHTYANTGTYVVTVVAYSGGAATTTYTQNVIISNPILMPLTFENAALNYSFSDFGNVSTSKVNNPDISGINLSSKVGRLVKNNGAETWGGTIMVLDSPIDFSTLNKIRIKVWSPQIGAVVKLKLENLTDAGINAEVDQTTTVANAWQYLTYDFSGANLSQSYSKVVLFFDFGNPGNGATYYFDDIYLTNGDEPKTLPLTFESTTINYGFNDFGGAFASKVANPDATGINTTANVARVVKNAGSEVWAGTAITLTEPIDFSVYHKIKIKVWSPQAGIPVLLKLENSANTGINREISVTTTVANGWEELTYDFTGINNNNAYQNVVLFFDFGTNGTGASYYFDDVKLSN